MSKIKNAATPIVEQICGQFGYLVVDVEYVKEYTGQCLNIYIDKEGGISLDDCEKVSKALSPLLDEVDISNGENYRLCVSSPGLDRKFGSTKEYVLAIGKKVVIKLYAPQEGKKEFVGLLEQANDQQIAINIDGKTTIIERTKISSASHYIMFKKD